MVDIADMREIAGVLEQMQPPNGDLNCPSGITLSAESPRNIAGYLRAAADEIEALRKGVEAIAHTAAFTGEASIAEMLRALLKGTPNGQG